MAELILIKEVNPRRVEIHLKISDRRNAQGLDEQWELVDRRSDSCNVSGSVDPYAPDDTLT